MIKVSTLIGKLKNKFEGGVSFTIDWYSVLEEGAQALLQNIAPKTLNIETAIYGGIIGGLQMYYCPSDCNAPNGLFNNLSRLKYSYVAPNVFSEKISDATAELIFTIVYKNGVKFVLVNSGSSISSFTVNEMDSTSGITSDMTLTSNDYDYISGTGALQGTFTNTNNSLSANFSSVQDLSSYLYGTILIPFKITDTKIVESIKFRLYTSALNYYEITANLQSSLIDGWNFARLKISDKAATGSPDIASIASWAMDITMTSGQSQTVIIDSISIQESNLWLLNYTSNAIFVDETTYARKSSTSNDNDNIDLTEEEIEILKYECLRIAWQEASLGSAGKAGNEVNRFDGELKRKYMLYYAKNPSNELPISYNVSPNISRGGNSFYNDLI